MNILLSKSRTAGHFDLKEAQACVVAVKNDSFTRQLKFLKVHRHKYGY